jgi:hypothetical protein
MRPFAVISDGLPQSNTAVHERVGLLVDWRTNLVQRCFRGRLKTPVERNYANASWALPWARGAVKWPK